jgi:hypothetical protein
MTSYTLAILVFALNPIVKNLLGIEIVLYLSTQGSIIRKISVIGICLEPIVERAYYRFNKDVLVNLRYLSSGEENFSDLASFCVLFCSEIIQNFRIVQTNFKEASPRYNLAKYYLPGIIVSE